MPKTNLRKATSFAVLAFALSSATWSFGQDFARTRPGNGGSGNQGASLAGNENVIIIDEGADLAHPQLANSLNRQSASGFPGATLGWNGVSNDAVYMPAYVLQKFTANPAHSKDILDLYSRVEQGDKAALDQIRSSPDIMNELSEVLDLAHGTHVSGIVAKNSLGTAKLQSLNVFTPSTPAQPANGAATPGSPTKPSIFMPVRARLMEIWARKKPGTGSGSGAATAPGATTAGSAFDDKKQMDQYISQMAEQDKQLADIATRYVAASNSRVANLSLGTAYEGIASSVQDMWKEELKQRNLPDTTPMNKKQAANAKYLVDSIYASSKNCWKTVFSANSSVLFVVAAGNDGGQGDAGNDDVHPTTPADLSQELTNVITVAAANQQGVIADFSSYGAKTANIGAWGTAVPSLAPGNNTVVMSGTSMASPFVAGVASHIRSLNAALNPAQIRALIEQTGTASVTLNGKTTSGNMINPDAAFAAASKASSRGIRLAVAEALQSDRMARDGFWGAAWTSPSDLIVGGGGSGNEPVETSDVVKALMRKF